MVYEKSRTEQPTCGQVEAAKGDSDSGAGPKHVIVSKMQWWTSDAGHLRVLWGPRAALALRGVVGAGAGGKLGESRDSLMLRGCRVSCMCQACPHQATNSFCRFGALL